MFIQIIMLAVMAAAAFTPGNAQPILTASDDVSRTGHFQLNWQYKGSETMFILQQDTHPDFPNPHIIYNGPDLARTMTGMLNGEYFFRVRAENEGWSETASVKVEHYPLSTAFIFLGLGALVFLATAILIIGGHIKHRKLNA